MNVNEKKIKVYLGPTGKEIKQGKAEYGYRLVHVDSNLFVNIDSEFPSSDDYESLFRKLIYSNIDIKGFYNE